MVCFIPGVDVGGGKAVGAKRKREPVSYILLRTSRIQNLKSFMSSLEFEK